MNGSRNSFDDVTRKVTVSPGVRRWLIKGALTASVLGLVATSPPPEWRVEDTGESVGMHFRQGGFRVQQSEGTVLFRTPRGQWHLDVDFAVRSYELGVRYRPKLELELDERVRALVRGISGGDFIVSCKEKLCEGSIQALLRMEPVDDNVPREGAQMTLGDGGLVPLDPPVGLLRAAFKDEQDGSFMGCNEADGPPKTIGVEVTVTPFTFDETSGTISGSDAGTPLGTDAGVDAGSAASLGPVLGLDAGL